jgi:hypothetical protein
LCGLYSSAGGRRHPTAEAGCPYRDFRARLRQIEPLLDQSHLSLFPATSQAFVKPVQRPQIIGVLAGPAELAVKTKVGTIDRLVWQPRPEKATIGLSSPITWRAVITR